MDKTWLDATQPVEERVEQLLSEMTLAEKVGQLHQPQNVASGEHTEALRHGGVGSTVLASGATAGNVADDGVAVRALNQAQRIAVEESRLGIPVLFARDVIHGHRTVLPIRSGRQRPGTRAWSSRAPGWPRRRPAPWGSRGRSPR